MSPLSDWFKNRLFGPGPKGPTAEAAANARREFGDAIQPYTDLAIGPFVKLPEDRAKRVYDTVASMMGPQTGIFAGKLAKTANLDKLAKAEQLERAGVDADAIWKATGWGRGKDNKWRFEIDDSKAGLKPEAREMLEASDFGDFVFGDFGPKRTRLADIYHHPEFFAAYPHLAELPISRMPDARTGDLGRNYGNRIELNADRSLFDLDSVLGHELTHSVQKAEGFARGNNARVPETPILNAVADKDRNLASQLVQKLNAPSGKDLRWKLYQNSAGEVEARSVQARLAYDKLRRRVRPPWQDEDVPRQSQIPFGFRND